MTIAPESAAESSDVGGTTLERELTTVLSDLDQVRLKLDRLREESERRSSELRIKVPTPK